MGEYADLQARLGRGWNTWNTRSVLAHVHLPSGFCLSAGLKEYATGQYLKEALIGRQEESAEEVRPGPRTYDGHYTELTLAWRGITIRVESAALDDDLALLFTPVANEQQRPPTLIIETGILWNRPGQLVRDRERVTGVTPEGKFPVFSTHATTNEMQIAAQTPYLGIPLAGPVGISTGKHRPPLEIQDLMKSRRAELEASRRQTFGDLAPVYEAMQTCLAWNTIFEPSKARVVTPVSRVWNAGHWGGYVLFCWDTYFAAYMAAVDNKDLAYANAIEMTREKTASGFVPNFAAAGNVCARDRSQPPVGSLVVRELFRRFGDRWFIEEVFDDLLEWNRWWPAERSHDGLLCWGSTPYENMSDNKLEIAGVGNRQGAAYESGLDDSPMYDDVPYDPESHLMCLADAGLSGLYLMDCACLADIANALGRHSEADELRTRGHGIADTLGVLWDEDFGLFLNRRTDTGELSRRISPTNFYPMLWGGATQAQAERMVHEHLYNPEEFWGDWVLPSIARNDPAYHSQYWRGTIWAPTNFLVYLGLRHYSLPEARADLAARSLRLFMEEWDRHGHVHENYDAQTGHGAATAYYHWGGLLGLMTFIERGYLAGPEQPL